jgi:hypothetical protein
MGGAVAVDAAGSERGLQRLLRLVVRVLHKAPEAGLGRRRGWQVELVSSISVIIVSFSIFFIFLRSQGGTGRPEGRGSQ